jgi:hypothetical protein
MRSRLPSSTSVRTLLLLALTALSPACGSGDEPPPTPPAPVQRPTSLNVQLKSRRGGTSHEAGKNCMACHGPNGLGPGLFTVAGTAVTSERQPNPNATLTLATQINGGGTVLLTLEADASGNFYTTEPVPLPDTPVFPKVTSAVSDAFNYMPFSTVSGACNMCHVGGKPVFLE